MEGVDGVKVGALSPDLAEAGIGPKNVARLTGMAAVCLVPAILNPSLQEFRGKSGQLFHGVLAAGEIPVMAAVYMLSYGNTVLTAEVYGAMQLVNLTTRFLNRGVTADRSLAGESIVVRLPVKLAATAAEVVLPTVLTQGSKVEGEGYKKLHTASSILEGVGIGMTSLAIMTGRTELAISGFASYAAGRVMMLAAEVSERQMPKVNMWGKETDEKVKQIARNVSVFAKDRATDVWNKLKAIGHKGNGGGS